MSFFTELKRRNVIRVGIAYLITAWLIAQVLELVFDSFGAPEWAMKAVLVVLAAGLPLVLVFSWIFELTPEGLKRDSEVDHSDIATTQAHQKLNRATIVVLVLALAYFVWESRFAGDTSPASQESGVAQQQIAPAEVVKPEPAVVTADKSIAVLPFMNMSSDQEQEYFSDGITEEIINALVKIPGLAIPARTSVFAYKGRLQDVREIGRELNVAHVLEGSIRSQGKQVRITAQLINVESGYHLWSETFDRQLENIFAVQEEIAGAIASVLVGELGVEVAAVPNQTRDMEAYDLYLQGRAALRNRDDAAIAMFEEVTRQDPAFAPGWAALAMARNSIRDEDDAAIVAAEKALAIDPENVDALNAKAAALRGLGHWSDAEMNFKKALAIDPSSAELLEDWAEFLNFVGRTDEALEVTTRGIAIEPGLVPLQQEFVSSLLAADRFEEALEYSLGLQQRGISFRWYLMLPVWISAAELGKPDTIPPKQALPMDVEIDPRVREYRALIDSQHLSNPTEAWGKELRAFLEREFLEGIEGPLPWMSHIVLTRAGQIDFVMERFFMGKPGVNQDTLEWLWTPVLKPVRQDPRFGDFLEANGLVAYWDATSWPKWCQRKDDGVVACH